MKRRNFLIFMSLLLVLSAFTLGVDQGNAQSPTGDGLAQDVQGSAQSTVSGAQGTAQQRRQEAFERLQQAIQARHEVDPSFPPYVTELQTPPQVQPQALSGFNPAVDYTKPNYANSPNLRKFVDSLPGLGSANANNLGQYIPVAVPDTTTYPGSDYYEIGLKQYQEQMHPDLPAAGT